MSLDDALHHIKVARLRSAIEKKASFWRGFTQALAPKNLGGPIGGALIAAGAGAAVASVGSGVTAGYRAIREKIEKPKAFKAMMSSAPGLKKEDSKGVQMTFNTLYGMNRRMAKDPLVAGSFVAKHVNRAEIGGEAGAYVDPQTVKTLMDAGSKPRSAGPIESAWQRGAQVDPKGFGKGREKLPKFQQQYEQARTSNLQKVREKQSRKVRESNLRKAHAAFKS